MTDKKTDGDDFALNHLDEDVPYDPLYDESTDNDVTTSLIDESLTNAPFIPEPGNEVSPFAAWDKSTSPDSAERREPRVGSHDDRTAASADLFAHDSAEPGDHDHLNQQQSPAMDNESEPVRFDMTPHAADNTDEPSPLQQRLPIILAALAMLFSLLAIALHLGGSGDASPTADIENSSRIQALEQRLSSQEQLRIQQKQAFETQLNHLQEQVISLSGMITALPRKQPTVTAKTITPKASSVAKSSKPTVTPATSHRGEWVINIVSLDSLSAANKEQSRLRKRGLRTEVAEITVHGRTWYRVRSQGFVSKEAADRYKQTLASKYGIKDAWTQKL
ncbi:SPOR domain-containing protein [Mariprofundus ferrooxydans]|uniref:SPOR domain-containing protein n=1 Tax=Mariprofundus ferrooxydans PV-1 TaxID=314345 RepID=Q0EXS4_9PROT|nr:SPOR domain-containing protein [Mariprofundus ferrooxydans]EAU54128.1 hypothetical protein SPV1_00822 [Mariprofundus ferrooxydans PV-1]KON48927.1 hypothetical protein AL013_00925 [Mariprofundus ferrooxydans]